MCKIITLTNLNKVKSIEKLIKAAAVLVTEVEKDGMGYAIQGSNGTFGERTVSTRAFIPMAKRQGLRLPFVKETRNSFGQYGKAQGAGMFHGRTSTNSTGLLNCHPIVKHNWTLIHNGVVSNHGRKYEALTSNDTEHLVEYMANEGIAGIEANLTGYYAFTAIAPNGDLHVVKDSIASLYVTEIPGIESLIFATRESHIVDLCKEMKWKYSKIEAVQDDVHLIFRAGKLISNATIQPRGNSSYESQYSHLSLGKTLDYDEYDTFNYTPEVKKSENWAAGSVMSPDNIAFLNEMAEFGDDTYFIQNWRGETLTYAEFDRLQDVEKLDCQVVRPDGTVLDQDDYESCTLYSGAM